MENKAAVTGSCPVEKVELRRDVTVWGSYMWGYADVGADIYAALGLVMAAAHGGTSLAFLAAGLVYIMIGLAYTEMASTYPVAGGGQFFTLRGLGDFWGYVAGVALLLDYTIDIALFATASSGYMNFFMPYLIGVPPEYFAMDIWIFKKVNPVWASETIILILFLIWLNIKGIRESSLFNEIIGAVDHRHRVRLRLETGALYPAVEDAVSFLERVYVRVFARHYLFCRTGVHFPGSSGNAKACNHYSPHFHHLDLYRLYLCSSLFHDGPWYFALAGISGRRSSGQTCPRDSFRRCDCWTFRGRPRSDDPPYFIQQRRHERLPSHLLHERTSVDYPMV